MPVTRSQMDRQNKTKQKVVCVYRKRDRISKCGKISTFGECK